jgi:hypothetical protein
MQNVALEPFRTEFPATAALEQRGWEAVTDGTKTRFANLSLRRFIEVQEGKNRSGPQVVFDGKAKLLPRSRSKPAFTAGQERNRKVGIRKASPHERGHGDCINQGAYYDAGGSTTQQTARRSVWRIQDDLLARTGVEVRLWGK